MARQAGEILLEVYARGFDVEIKGRSEPVTEADKRANAYLVSELRRLFPNDGVVAEETPDRSDALRTGRCWYVDPLDGTKEFIARRDDFAVMLGLAIDGHSTLGVVYQPARNKMYAGVVGQGATLQTKEGTQALQVSEVAVPSDLHLVVSRSHRPPTMDALAKRLGIHRESQSGSVGLKVGMIAERNADLYVHISDKSSTWDACGPEAILRAAGGVFTDVDGEPFVYGGTEMRNIRGILACNQAAYDQVIPIVQELAREVGFLRAR